MSDWLNKIVGEKTKLIASLRAQSLPAPIQRTERINPQTLKRRSDGSIHLWTEIKLRSPSAGPLSRSLTVAQRAETYERCGASVISVLTDEPFFDGHFDHLAEVSKTVGIPTLCKDFILDELQLVLAANARASLALLIVRLLPIYRLEALVLFARSVGIEPVVEVVTHAELDFALQAGATIIGVNARDLDTLTMNAARARDVLAAIPVDRVAVYLSGVQSADDVAALRSLDRVDGVLTGEALMRQDDPSALLTEFARAATTQPRSRHGS